MASFEEELSEADSFPWSADGYPDYTAAPQRYYVSKYAKVLPWDTTSTWSDEYSKHKITSQRVPRVIYTFWHDMKTKPKIVSLSIKSWRKELPDWRIEIYTKTTFMAKLEILLKHRPNDWHHIRNVIYGLLKNNDWPHVSDIFRYCILAQEGGLWMDASILMFNPEEVIQMVNKLETSKYEMGAYYSMRGPCPIVDNFFIMAKPNSSFMWAWLMEYIWALSVGSCENYIRALVKQKVFDYATLKATRLFSSVNECYLVGYISFMKLYKMIGKERVYMRPADHYIMAHSGKSGQQVVRDLGKQSLMKFTKQHRGLYEGIHGDFERHLSRRWEMDDK